MLTNPEIKVFNTGEITPYMWSRTDFKKYPAACKLMENFIPLVYGAFTKRPGSYFVANAKYSNKTARLEPFIFNSTQAYILEIGEEYIRIFTNTGQLIHTLDTVSAWLTSTAYTAGYSYVKENSIIYRCLVSHISGTFATDLAANKWIAQSIYEVPSAYQEADLFDLDITHNNDISFITKGGYKPAKLSRYASLTWVVEDIAFKDGPYQAENTTAAHTMAASGTTGSVTLTAAGSGNTPFTANCVGQHVWLKHTGTPDVIGWGIITARASSTSVTLSVQKTLGGTGTTTSWRLGHYSQDRGYPYTNIFHSGRHYFGGTDTAPGRVDGSVPDEYDTFSPVDQDSGEVTDASAIAGTIASGETNIIRWLLSMDALFVGTSGAESVFVAEGGDTALTPTNYVIKEISQQGSKRVQPVKINNNGYFIQNAGRKLREITYNYTEDKYNFPDLTIFAEHLTYSGFKQIAYQKEPFPTFWIVTEDGRLLSLSYDKKQEVFAWGRHTLGGAYSKVLSVAVIPYIEENRDQIWLLVERYINNQLVRYIEVLAQDFNAEIDQEQAYFTDCGYTYDNPLDIENIEWDAGNSYTKITITGHGLSTDDTVVIREINTNNIGNNFNLLNLKIFDITKIDNNTFSIDYDSSTLSSYISFQEGTVRKFITEITSGLDHLEGELVDVVVDGGVEESKYVTSGAITLDSPGATVHIGLNYIASWQSLPLAIDLGNGNSSGSKKQKVHSLDIDVYRTNYFQYGTSIYTSELEELYNTIQTDTPGEYTTILDELPTRQPDDYMDLPPVLKTGKFTVPIESQWGKTPDIIIKSDLPVPLTVLNITPVLSVN